MPFEIVGDITQVETIATGNGVGPYAARSCIGMRRMASAGRRSSASVMSTKSRKPRLRQPVRFVVCIENSGYPASLELHKIYRTVPDQSATREGDLRIVDESGEDYRPARLQSA